MIFLNGIVIGFAIAAPVGPIGLLCINRSMSNGFKIGLFSGLGAAIADGVYGLIAGFGLTTISSFLLKEQFIIRIIGGFFLIYLGFKTIKKSIITNKKENTFETSILHSFSTTFLLTLTNPMTIMSFIAIFAGLGLGTEAKDYLSALLLVFGIFAGSSLWWLFLALLSSFLKKNFLNDNLLKSINIFSGIIILIFGLISLKIILTFLK